MMPRFSFSAQTISPHGKPRRPPRKDGRMPSLGDAEQPIVCFASDRRLGALLSQRAKPAACRRQPTARSTFRNSRSSVASEAEGKPDHHTQLFNDDVRRQ